MAKIWRTFNSNWELQAVYYNEEPPVAGNRFMTVDDGPNRHLFINYAGRWQPYSDWETITIKAWPNPFAELKPPYTSISSRSGETGTDWQPTFNHGGAKVSFTKAYPIAARDEWVEAWYARWDTAFTPLRALLHEIYTELEQR